MNKYEEDVRRRIEEVTLRIATEGHGGLPSEEIEALLDRAALYIMRCLNRQYPNIDPTIAHTVGLLVKETSLEVACRVLYLERQGQLPRGFGDIDADRPREAAEPEANGHAEPEVKGQDPRTTRVRFLERRHHTNGNP